VVRGEMSDEKEPPSRSTIRRTSRRENIVSRPATDT
jgi:hypothetical protein